MDYIKMNRKLLEVLRARMENKMDWDIGPAGKRDTGFVSNKIFYFDVELKFPKKLEIYEDRPGIVVIGLPLGEIYDLTASLNVDNSASRCATYNYTADVFLKYLYKDKSMVEVKNIIGNMTYPEMYENLEKIMSDIKPKIGVVPVKVKMFLKSDVFPSHKRRDVLPLATFNFNKGEVTVVRERSVRQTSPKYMHNISLSGLQYSISYNTLNTLYKEATVRSVPIRLIESEVIFDEHDHDLHYKGPITIS